MLTPIQIVITTCTLSILATTSVASDGDVFACHVMTQSGQPTISFIQTDDLSFAKKVAMQNPAQLADNSESTVTEVIECINSKTGKFSDYGMREYLKSMPR